MLFIACIRDVARRMAKAKKTKPKEHLSRWRATLIKGTPAKYLGHVYAKDEADAVKEERSRCFAGQDRDDEE